MAERRRNRLVYSVAEAAELLGIGRSTAYDLVARSELATVRLGGRAVVTRPTLTELIGMEPPLPHELDADRPTPPPDRAATAPTPRRRALKQADQPALPFPTRDAS